MESGKGLLPASFLVVRNDYLNCDYFAMLFLDVHHDSVRLPLSVTLGLFATLITQVCYTLFATLVSIRFVFAKFVAKNTQRYSQKHIGDHWLINKMKYFSVNLYKKILNCAIAEGMSRKDFEDWPISLEDAENLEFISADAHLKAHEWLDEKLKPGFAIRVGQQMKIEDYGVLGLSWRTCSKVREIFDRSERYFKLLSNTYNWEVKDEKVLSHIILNRPAHDRGLQLSSEASLSATVVVVQAMSEKSITPIQVSFRHKAPKDITSFKEAFNCSVSFDQPQYSISYKSEDLNLRTAKADASINSYLLQQVDEKTKGIKIPGSKFVRDVESLIKDALPTGIPSIHHIADLTAMSNRTLTRRLSEAGVTYRDLIRKTQETIAKDMLHNTAQSIGEIAFLTGFSEQSAFNRAFKKWTNQSPSEFRKSI